jgi:hypothetical protein
MYGYSWTTQIIYGIIKKKQQTNKQKTCSYTTHIIKRDDQLHGYTGHATGAILVGPCRLEQGKQSWIMNIL